MDVGPSLVADGQPAEPIEPSQRALDHPAVAAQPLAGIKHPPRDARLDAAPAQVSTAGAVVITFVGVELFGSAPRPAQRPMDGRDRFEHLGEKEAVVAVGRRELHGERDALGFDHKMALRARTAAIRRIRPGELAPLFAGVLALSTAARLQSS